MAPLTKVFSGAFSTLTHSHSTDSEKLREHVPWTTSPLDKRAHNQLQQQSSERSTAQPVFKHHHESGAIELFYDLFFVANLTTFTQNHEIVDATTLKDYVGFFTLLWTTWLQVSLFDVRFSSDSVFNRICKAVSFGMMTWFAVIGTYYNTSDIVGSATAFRAMSLVLMISRLALIVQYGVVLWYVREYKKTFAPLISTMAVLFVTAMIFLGTHWGFHTDGSNPHTYVAFYVVVCIEAVAIIAISSAWRVGIIGMTISVSKILQNANTVTAASAGGVVVSAVLLVYFIWVLYFDQIEHDRFGTVRQQIWTVLHFPLHIAILLTVEGSAALVLWTIISSIDMKLKVWWDEVANEYYNNTILMNSTAEYIDLLREAMDDMSKNFKPHVLEEGFNYEVNITSIENINATFGSYEWVQQAGEITTTMFGGVENFIFENFKVETPQSESSDEVAKGDAFFNVYITVFLYFFISAGCFLVILAVLYGFGKRNKSREEWSSIALRTVAGIGITMICVALEYSNTITATTRFLYSAWPIPLVVLIYFLVIVIDNLLLWRTNKRIRHMAIATTTTPGNEYNNNENDNDNYNNKLDNSSQEDSTDGTLPVRDNSREKTRASDHELLPPV